MNEIDDLSERLAGLEGPDPARAKSRSHVLTAILGTSAIGLLGLVAYSAVQRPTEEPLPTAKPEEFQMVGEAFGGIKPIEAPARPEPETPAPDPVPEPDAELLAQLAALRAEIETLQNAPVPVVEKDTAAADAIEALTAQIAALAEASQNAQQRFAEERAALDRELQQLRMDLDLARLQAPTPAPGPSEADRLEAERLRLQREEDARRLAELQRRQDSDAAFQQARIMSPTIAYGGNGTGESALAERTFGDVTDFVLNGALPTTVTQAQVIANPANTIVQGTMIQAAIETAISSELPGQVRAIIIEDVHSYDGSRILIAKGSKLIGRYRSGADIAQSRITIAWDRVILPSNQTVTISAFGGDELGRAGATGFVDTRFKERFGSSALISLISTLPGATAAQINDEPSANVLQDIGEDFADTADSVIDDYLSIGPVVYVEQGARVTVMVDRDLEIF